MQIRIENPVQQTIIFSLIFFTILILLVRKTNKEYSFDYSLTQELKGFAILTIIFSHIGYFLSEDHQFLFPLSILAGVGVNLFLFLSGFGLTISTLRSGLTLKNFYKKRLTKLFLPLWIVLFLLIGIDLVILHKSYSLPTLIQSFLGFFPKADLFQDLNPPLWYFSLIFFYYLTFPLFFWKRTVYLTPLILLIIPFFLLQLPLPINPSVSSLYKLHFVSFPLGIFFGLITQHKIPLLRPKLKYIFIPLFITVFIYTSFKSGVDTGKLIEQTTSLITMFSIIFLFITKKVELQFLNLFGIYSYEIYLIHWPMLSRYDLFYKYLPAYLATLLYLGLFLAIGYLINKLVVYIIKKLTKKYI